MSPSNKERQIQQQYYASTADQYNAMHVTEDGEHEFALAFLIGMLDYFHIRSILDVGSGTGRVILQFNKHRPDIHVVGVEPVQQLREIGYAQGISTDALVDGDATQLQFSAKQFDLVCSFGVLHHIRNPSRAVSEMLRVSGKAIFISDSNNFGQGSYRSRTIKQLLNRFGLWKAANWIKTRGKGYGFSDGDGLYYSYSVFNNYRQIRRQCKSVHIVNTKDGSINPYATASHVAMLGVKSKAW